MSEDSKEPPSTTSITENTRDVDGEPIPTGEKNTDRPISPDDNSNNTADGHGDKPIEDIQSRVSKPLWALIVLTILSSTFLFSLDNTIVADIQPSIIARLGEVGKLSWLGVAFVLGSSSTIVTWGKIYGIFSAKWLYIGSIVLFELGSAVCGAAPTMNAMIVGRSIAGVGGAGMYVGCLQLLSLTTTMSQRPIYMAFIGFTWGSGTVLGPVVGGAFAQNRHTTWRWAFYINLCIGLAFSPIYLYYLPVADPKRGQSYTARLAELDFLGMFLNVAAFAPLIMAINFGGSVYAWNSGAEIALWVSGGLLLALFALQQRFAVLTTKTNRMFPCDFLRMPIMWLLFALMSAAATCVFVPTFYIPLYFQFVRGDTPLGAAVRLLPFIVLMVFCGLLNGALMSKFGYYMPWYLAGGTLTLVGGSLMHTVTATTSSGHTYGFIALIGIGAGLFIQAGFSVAQAKVPASRASDAAGFISLAQNLGIVLALAISGSVFQNRAVQRLRGLLPGVPAEAVRGAITGTNSQVLRGLPEGVRERVLEAIVRAIGETYWLVVAAGGLAVLGSLCMRRERLFMQAGAAG